MYSWPGDPIHAALLPEFTGFPVIFWNTTRTFVGRAVGCMEGGGSSGGGEAGGVKRVHAGLCILHAIVPTRAGFCVLWLHFCYNLVGRFLTVCLPAEEVQIYPLLALKFSLLIILAWA